MQTADESEKFTELIGKNKAIIYKICYVYCTHKTHCDDLVQEIVCELWRSFKSNKPHLSFSAWLYCIACK